MKNIILIAIFMAFIVNGCEKEPFKIYQYLEGSYSGEAIVFEREEIITEWDSVGNIVAVDWDTTAFSEYIEVTIALHKDNTISFELSDFWKDYIRDSWLTTFPIEESATYHDNHSFPYNGITEYYTANFDTDNQSLTIRYIKQKADEYKEIVFEGMKME